MDHNNMSDASVSRDAAGIGPHTRPDIRLTPLGELKNFDVVAGDADVRGWDVRTVSGREIGKVEDMLVDAQAGEVVMLDIDLKGSDRHTLAPVRAAQLDRARRVVVLDTSDLQDSDTVPSLRRNAAPTDDEAQQFHSGYQRAYGKRGFDRDRDYQVSRGDHDVEFRRRYAEQDRTDDARLAAGAAAASEAARREAAERDARRAHQDEILAEQTRRDAARREIERQQAEARERMDADRIRREEESRRAESGGAPRQLRWAQGQQQPDEEIVVERRPVIEEVIIRRRVVDPSELRGGAAGASQGMGAGSGAADRATDSGFADRTADRLDDVKDRFDGNPASRPGPDSTDRRI